MPIHIPRYRSRIERLHGVNADVLGHSSFWTGAGSEDLGYINHDRQIDGAVNNRYFGFDVLNYRDVRRSDSGGYLYRAGNCDGWPDGGDLKRPRRCQYRWRWYHVLR